MTAMMNFSAFELFFSFQFVHGSILSSRYRRFHHRLRLPWWGNEHKEAWLGIWEKESERPGDFAVTNNDWRID